MYTNITQNSLPLASFNCGKKTLGQKKGKKKGGIPEPDGAVCVCVLTLGHGQATHTDGCLQLGHYISAQACADSEP